MREELQQMEQRTRELLMMNKALLNGKDVLSRKEEERGLTSIQDIVDTST